MAEPFVTPAEMWPEAVALAAEVDACPDCTPGYCADHAALVAAHHGRKEPT